MIYFRGMDLLKLSGVGKKEKHGFTVKIISFTQQPFQKIALAGETGSGKTTLLKLIAGLLQPDEGEIIFEQRKLKGPFDQLIPGHAGIAYLSQHFELRNNYWVHEILSYANELSEAAALRIYQICRIDHLLFRRTDQLSGGERQRIALARLLVGSPRLLLMDEPFSNLDPLHKKIIRSVINDINAELGISCIMVSHDAPDILPWADTVLVLKEGELIQAASASAIYYQPVNEYVAGLFGEYNLVTAQHSRLLQFLRREPLTGKNMLIRPEQFIIQKAGDGLKGIIQNKWFMGSYYMFEVMIDQQLLKISSADRSFDCGDEVSLLLPDASAWYL
jgi:ABC-type sugar transport system ATPase subunit